MPSDAHQPLQSDATVYCRAPSAALNGPWKTDGGARMFTSMPVLMRSSCLRTGEMNNSGTARDRATGNTSTAGLDILLAEPFRLRGLA